MVNTRGNSLCSFAEGWARMQAVRQIRAGLTAQLKASTSTRVKHSVGHTMRVDGVKLGDTL